MSHTTLKATVIWILHEWYSSVIFIVHLWQGTPARWRDFHSATGLGNLMYVFGGRSDYGGEIFTNHEIYCNKIQVFDTSTSTWMEPVTYGIQPIGRRSHSACKSCRTSMIGPIHYWSFCKLNFTIDSLIFLISFSFKSTLCIGNWNFFF